MATVNVHAAKTHFSSLLDRVAAGEEIVIAKAGKPVARLTGLSSGNRLPRRLGSLAGRAVVPADFDAPLPDDVLDTFEGD
jgi:prevent-host-death family protein